MLTLLAMITTSLRQRQYREALSEGSRRQRCELTNRNRIEGLAPGTSQHKVTKSVGSRRKVNAAVVHQQFMLLSGEICFTCRVNNTARRPAMVGVMKQKSADGVVPLSFSGRKHAGRPEHQARWSHVYLSRRVACVEREVTVWR